jgi:hypothetical protein
MATGYILRFPLPPGTNKLYTLWGLSRHDWGTIHFWISTGLIIVIFIHVAVHWSWIISLISKRVHGDSLHEGHLAKSGALAMLLIISCFTLFAILAENNVAEISDPVSRPGTAHLNRKETNNKTKATNEFVSKQKITWIDVYPIFEQRCVSCHGPDRHFANFRADLYEDFFKVDNDLPLILPGDITQSPLIEIISGKRKDIPAYDRHLLQQNDIQKISDWIRSGANK